MGFRVSDQWQVHDATGRRKYINTTERERFLAYADYLAPDRRALCYALVYTGARISELLALTRHHLDADAHSLTIRTLKRRRCVFRAVPIPEAVTAMLLTLPVLESGHLWSMHRTTAWREVTRLMRDVQICGPMACNRGLRHAFGIRAATSKVPPNLIQKWMGHASLTTTAIYIDAVGSEEREFAARMAQFSMRVDTISRSEDQSIMAAAAYRAGEKLWDDRLGKAHDFRHKSKEVEHAELLFPDNSPEWVQGISREDFWNRVDRTERRKDAQTARDLRIMIPREVPAGERIQLVRDYVIRCFVKRGMVADIGWHNELASDGGEQPHAHILFTMRPLAEHGFGLKSRHDMVPDPTGAKHPNGRPVMVESNPDSWNSSIYYEKCREEWENIANEALARAGSKARIDRRSLVERGLARIPEPALRLAFHLKELRGVMKERFGQFQYAKHYQAVEKRAQAAFNAVEPDPIAALHAEYEAAGRRSSRDPTPGHKVTRFLNWFERQVARMAPGRHSHHLAHAHAGRAPPRTSATDMER